MSTTMDAFAEDAAEIASLRAEIERLRDLCSAYKGQVEAGAAEIERLRADLNSMSFAHTLAEEQRDTATRALSDLRSRIENPDEGMVEQCAIALSMADPDERGLPQGVQMAPFYRGLVRAVLSALAKDLTPPSDPRPRGDSNV